MELDKKTKAEQLGMNPSTANGRLQKDILWSLIVSCDRDTCCKCGHKMERDTFSIEHIVPWLHSENPVELYFDLNNISFSHLLCNIADRRIPHQKYFTEEDRKAAKNLRNREYWTRMGKEAQSELRREKYEKYNC